MPGMDAGAGGAVVASDAGRRDAGATTQTVSNPVLTGAAPDAGTINSGAPGSGVVPANGPAPTSAMGDDQADGCACRVAERAPERELPPWIALGFLLRSTRNRVRRRSRCSR
jgi:hypothetical protein